MGPIPGLAWPVPLHSDTTATTATEDHHDEHPRRRPQAQGRLPPCRGPPSPPLAVGLAALAAAGVAAAALGVVSAAPAGASSRPTVVKAVETDFHIALSKSTFSPGKYTFVAQNKGQVTHSLEITGPGLSNAKAKNISPGHSTKLTVTFKKGAYDIFCPIPGHKCWA